MAPARLEVGRVGRPYGLRGEVAVQFTSNRSERTEPGSQLYDGHRTLLIAASRRHGARWIVRFAGVDDRTQAEQLRGHVLTAEPLTGDDLWAHELVGAEVVDREGSPLGTVTAVEANPAHDLLVLDGGGLVPIVFVAEHTPGRVVVDVPDGLLDA
jgi:16S rRNA processing protein RimM